MVKQRPIELLAPAKNLECGIEAINHGADAVYIGAPRFGARAAAGNSIEDIKALVEHAHLYNYIRHCKYNPAQRGTAGNGENDMGIVPCRCRCPDHTGYGYHSP